MGQKHVSRVRVFRNCISIVVGHLEGEKLYLRNEYNTKQATKDLKCRPEKKNICTGQTRRNVFFDIVNSKTAC